MNLLSWSRWFIKLLHTAPCSSLPGWYQTLSSDLKGDWLVSRENQSTAPAQRSDHVLMKLTFIIITPKIHFPKIIRKEKSELYVDWPSLDFASNYFFEKLKQFSKEDKNWNNFAESRNGAILCRWLPNYLTLKILQNKKMLVTQFRREGNKNIWSLKYLISKSSEIILNSARWVCKDLTHIKYLKGESKTIFSSLLYPVIWK